MRIGSYPLEPAAQFRCSCAHTPSWWFRQPQQRQQEKQNEIVVIAVLHSTAIRNSFDSTATKPTSWDYASCAANCLAMLRYKITTVLLIATIDQSSRLYALPAMLVYQLHWSSKFHIGLFDVEIALCECHTVTCAKYVKKNSVQQTIPKSFLVGKTPDSFDSNQNSKTKNKYLTTIVVVP